MTHPMVEILRDDLAAEREKVRVLRDALEELLASVEGLCSAEDDDGDVAQTFPRKLRTRAHAALDLSEVVK